MQNGREMQVCFQSKFQIKFQTKKCLKQFQKFFEINGKEYFRKIFRP